MLKLTFSILFSCYCSLLFSRPALASEKHDIPLLYKSVFGIFLHDRGPTSDRHESGVDPNWELQFNPPDLKLWRWLGAPYPMVGITPNFNGDTSVFYAGITYEQLVKQIH